MVAELRWLDPTAPAIPRRLTSLREEIVERVPERRLSYMLLSGLAIRDYRADVDLRPTADGTEIRWHTTFRSKLPGVGGV